MACAPRSGFVPSLPLALLLATAGCQPAEPANGDPVDLATAAAMDLAIVAPTDLAPAGPADLATAVRDLATVEPVDLALSMSRPLDLAIADQVDLATFAPVDLAMVEPADLSSPRPADLAVPLAMPDLRANPDLAQDVAPLSVTSVWPPSGPVGATVTIAGSGFQAGDTVEMAGNNVQATSFVTLSLTATAIVALVPACKAALPQSVQLRVSRNQGARTAGALPFSVSVGSVYYIAPTGSDSAAGTLAAPWQTIDGAAAMMKPGDTAYLRGGVYDGLFNVRPSGTASAPLTFAAYAGESPLLTNTKLADDTLQIWGSYVVVDGLRVTSQVAGHKAANVTASATHSTLSNCEIFGAPDQGLMLSGDRDLIYRNRIHDNGTLVALDHGIYVQGTNNIIRSNVIYNNFANGVQLYEEDGTTKGGNVVEYNYIYHNGYGSTAGGNRWNAGIIVAQGQPNNTLRYNRLCDNEQYGIYVIDNIAGTQIVGNVTCYTHQGGGIYPAEAGANTTLSGNVSFNDQGFALDVMGGAKSDGNVFYATNGAPVLQYQDSPVTLAALQAATGQDKTSRIANPSFANVPTGGFDENAAATYDFCTPLVPALCAIP